MTKQSLKDNVTSNDILSKKIWILTIPKMSFYWCLLKKKFEKIEGDLLAHVRQIQNTFLSEPPSYDETKPCQIMSFIPHLKM